MEDVAEKARRNLMVVSTGILAVWVLGIPLDGKLVGAVDLSAVQPWRAWIAALVVLTYFAARHHFAPSTADALQAWRARIGSEFLQTLERELQWSLTQFNVQGEQSPNLTINVPGRPAEGSGWQVDTTPRATFRKRQVTFPVYWGFPSRTPTYIPETSTSIMMHDVYYRPDGTGSFTFKFYLAAWYRAVRTAYTPSWNLLELTVPWFLAVGAAIVCICKLAASAYYSFPFIRQLLSA